MKARQLVRQVSVRLFGDDIGCHDGGCVFGHPGGMHTNGGCHADKESDAYELRRMVRQLAKVAETLAAMVPLDKAGGKEQSK